MRKELFIYLIVAAVVLAGCGKRAGDGNPAIDTAPQAHLFQMTPTTSGQKNEESEAQAKAIATIGAMPGYPTPYATYLVPSRLTTVTHAPTQIATVAPTQAQPTTIPTTSVPTQVLPTQTGPTATPTRVPPTATATHVPPTATPTSIPPTAVPIVQYVYAVQPGSPALVPNFANAAAGCSWQGIAGQVFDADGVQVKNLVVKAGGTWNGAAVNLLGMTGTSSAYGEGGYELVLGTKAVTSTNSVWVQVFDLASKPVTDKVYVSTSSDCTKNLTLLNFKEIVAGINIYIPMVIQTAAP